MNVDRRLLAVVEDSTVSRPASRPTTSRTGRTWQPRKS